MMTWIRIVNEKGAGRKPLIAFEPQLEANFQHVLRDHTAGDPMQADVRWTNLSRRAIARAVTALGTPISHHIAARWLRANGFRRRQTQKKQTMGSHADRNKQFERIAALKSEYVSAGNPIISVDTKKKELLGNFFRAGKLECKDPILVNDHDFPSAADGKLIPHGILDLSTNLGSIHLNTSHDTSEFACASLELWWQEEGCAAYPTATTLLVLCDGGGSNSATAFVFKQDLQALADRLGIEIRIAHFPPYCSKFNLLALQQHLTGLRRPIEHRLFPHVTRALQGVVLESVEIAKQFMEKTSTSTGLKLTVRCLEKVFLTGRKCAEDFRDSMRIVFDSVLPKWNYVAVPASA